LLGTPEAAALLQAGQNPVSHVGLDVVVLPATRIKIPRKIGDYKKKADFFRLFSEIRWTSGVVDHNKDA
jgi:hypothetical protein